MSAEKPYKPSEFEIQKGLALASEKERDESFTREDILKETNSRLEGQKTTYVYEMRKMLEAYSKQLDQSEADGMLSGTNSPELTADIEKTRKILAEIGEKMNEFQDLFKFDSSK